MEEERSDEALMRRLACDEVGAFDTLFVRHRRAVFNYTLRMVGDVGAADADGSGISGGTDCEDVCQRVWTCADSGGERGVPGVCCATGADAQRGAG